MLLLASLLIAGPSRASDAQVGQRPGDGAWSQLVTGRNGGITAVYDPVRDRMIAGGGPDPVTLSYDDVVDVYNEVWALSFANVLAAGGPLPGPLAGGLRAPMPNPASGRTTVTYFVRLVSPGTRTTRRVTLLR
jgi:hypothetical protein